MNASEHGICSAKHGIYIRSKVLELPIIVRSILLVSKWAARSALPVSCKVLLRRG